MVTSVSIDYLRAQADGARRAKAALVEDFVRAGRSRDEARCIVDAHCARGTARLLVENPDLMRRPDR